MLLYVAGVHLAATFAAAQIPSGDFSSSLSDTTLRRNVASILFERNLNTFNWTGILLVDTTAFGNRIRINEFYSSNIILVEGGGSEQRLRSDQQRLLMQLTRPLTDDINVRGEWSSLTYSDRKAVGLSTASFNTILGGIDYSPMPWLTFSPLVGHRWDNQIDIRDRGLSYNIRARTDGIDLDGYQIVGNAQFRQDRLDPRVLEQHFARFGAQKTFLGQTRDSLDVGFSRSRREFYTSASGALESRLENVLSVTNLLDYEFDESLIGSFFINLYNRTLDKDYRALRSTARAPAQYNTGIDEFRLDAFIQGVFTTDEGLVASARFAHSERNERHFAKDATGGFDRDTSSVPITARQAQEQEQTKDNLTRRTSLSGALQIPLSFSDRLHFSGAASILRYDTPSEQNVEDRDELLVALSIASTHSISRYLELTFSLDATLNHIVYLLGERSANNTINRVLRFAPRTLYTPFDFFSTMNSFEVLANYTVYDFEEQASQVKSFSYRQFGWIDSTSMQLSSRFGLDFLMYLKLYDRGQLNWREFTERRENSFVDKTFAIQARYSPEAGAVFAVGVRYFSQSRYVYTGAERRLDSFLRSFGPTCLIVWRLNAQSEVGIRGWYEQRRLPDGASKALANMTMNINITM